ncbi:MAG: M1 family metallopeptidase, partial [Myxococcota bacterium]
MFCPGSRRRLVGLLALVVGLLACQPKRVLPPPNDKQPTPTETLLATEPTGRLPEGYITPLRYHLTLQIDPDQVSFSGEVKIDVELEQPLRGFWIHGKDLRVSEVSLQPMAVEPKVPTAEKPVPPPSITGTYTEVGQGGRAKIKLTDEAPKGKATLTLRYEAPFSERLNGLYRVKSGDEWYAFTQMEPIWARHAFPCFDEPAFKTPWDVTLVVPDRSDTVAIANTQETSRRKKGNLREVIYAPTEPLPTYLIAFAVGPFDVVDAPPIPAHDVRSTPLPFRGIATKGRGPELAHALEKTPPMLTALETYFQEAYPYDKLDVIAVPDKGGAMENAGLITFRDWLLLVDPTNASVAQKRAFSIVMAHELAHQWFGNLVTMPWWDDIWLNEAFATWMSFRILEPIEPELEAPVLLLGGVQQAMSSDTLINARQIRQPVLKNDDIHNAFDRITYRKGGGVLSMFERYLGRETFRDGLTLYMKRHRHGSA